MSIGILYKFLLSPISLQAWTTQDSFLITAVDHNLAVQAPDAVQPELSSRDGRLHVPGGLPLHDPGLLRAGDGGRGHDPVHGQLHGRGGGPGRAHLQRLLRGPREPEVQVSHRLQELQEVLHTRQAALQVGRRQ